MNTMTVQERIDHLNDLLDRGEGDPAEIMGLIE